MLHLVGFRIEAAPLRPPPPADGRDGKGSGVVVGADVDEACIASDVVDAIRVSPRDLGAGKVVTCTCSGCLAGSHCRPLLSYFPISSFFLVSTEITGRPSRRHFLTSALMCRNCVSLSG